MKNLKYFSMLKTASVILFVSLALAACGKKGGGGNNNVIAPVYPGCVGCPAGSGLPLLDNVKFQYGWGTPYFDGVLQIMGQPDGMTDMNDVKAIVVYNGPITVYGTLNIINPNGLCGAAPGVYTMQTMAQGISNRGVIGGLRLMATGPGQIILEAPSFPYSEVYADPYVQPNHGVYRGSLANRIGMNMNLIVNNIPCGQVSTF